MKIVEPRVEIMTPIDGKSILRHIELCGRTCYKSEDKITDESAAKFVRGLIKSGHDSVIEHYSITAKFICDRGVSHEIVRHRIASYSQESTRYCAYDQERFGNEISCINVSGAFDNKKMLNMPEDRKHEIFLEWIAACVEAENHYMNMIELGAPPEVARSVLNNSTKTEIVVTMNLREWRHFFTLRTSLAAHPQIRQVAGELLEKLKAQIPVVFDDIEVETWEV